MSVCACVDGWISGLVADGGMSGWWLVGGSMDGRFTHTRAHAHTRTSCLQHKRAASPKLSSTKRNSTVGVFTSNYQDGGKPVRWHFK